MNETKTTIDINTIKQQAMAIITKPAEFFKSMPKTGGYVEPMIFLAMMGLITGIIRSVFLLKVSFGAALGALLVTTLITPLIAFVGAAIIFLIWKLMGSTQPYEVSYRCVAYTASIFPITTLLSLIPYLGGLAGTAWVIYLYFIASVEVHEIDRKKAQIVWAIIFAVLAIMGIGAERSSRKAEKWIEQHGGAEMTPEQAGEAFGEFFRGIENAAQEEQ